MIRRLTRDEAGMTMGLVVIMIVLIGVMGAGLLTFVQQDLNGVVQVNQGQRALEIADVGIEAARKHLADTDADPTHYRDDGLPGADPEDSEWFEGASPNKTLNFEGNTVTVQIRYLEASGTPALAQQPDNAPEVLSPAGATRYPQGRNYFRITAEGGNGDARRKVQAIYYTETIDFPVGFYATRDIDFGGNPTVNGVSFFAGRCINNFSAANISGTDQAYGNWAVNPPGSANPGPNRYNSVARATNAAGVAALGSSTAGTCQASSGVEYTPNGTARGENNQKAGTATPQNDYGRRDYDRSSNTISVDMPPKSFKDRGNAWGTAANPTQGQPTNVITFPFGRGTESSDDQAIEKLRQRAEDQGRYITINPTTEGALNIDDSTGPNTPARAVFPPDSNVNTVYFVEFSTSPQGSPITGAKGQANLVVGTPDGLSEGTIVVVNGDLNPQGGGSRDTFQGVMIVRDPDDTDTSTMEYISTGNPKINGYVNVEGDMQLSGDVNPFLPAILAGGIPNFYVTELWSWRECYTTTCR